MEEKLARLIHKIAIQLHLVAEGCTICSSRSRWPARKLLDTPSYATAELLWQRPTSTKATVSWKITEHTWSYKYHCAKYKRQSKLHVARCLNITIWRIKSAFRFQSRSSLEFFPRFCRHCSEYPSALKTATAVFVETLLELSRNDVPRPQKPFVLRYTLVTQT
jgi:hypothetical protein